MGDVKETVKGTPPAPMRSGGKSNLNLKDQLDEMVDTVNGLIAKKDEDTLTEGNDVKAENIRKAATLRAANSMLRAAKNLLEDY